MMFSFSIVFSGWYNPARSSKFYANRFRISWYITHLKWTVCGGTLQFPWCHSGSDPDLKRKFKSQLCHSVNL